jgi:opacity protein-like surface antigen
MSQRTTNTIFTSLLLGSILLNSKVFAEGAQTALTSSTAESNPISIASLSPASSTIPPVAPPTKDEVDAYLSTSPALKNTTPSSIHPIITVSGGVNLTSIQQSTSSNYVTGGNTVNNTWNGSSNGTQGIAGLFLGAETAVFDKSSFPLHWQFGLAYYKPFSASTISGTTKQLGTPYTYSYQVQSSQLLLDNKFLATFASIYHPYVSAGVGIARNTASNYQKAYNATYGQYSMGFTDNTSTSFSYEFGVGLDVDLINHWRLGLGYRYVNFGTASLGSPIQGTVDVNPSVNLKQALTTQEILGQLTYVF